MIWLPTGFVRVDKVMAHDNAGLRMSVLVREEKFAMEEMKAMVADLLNMGKTTSHWTRQC